MFLKSEIIEIYYMADIFYKKLHFFVLTIERISSDDFFFYAGCIIISVLFFIILALGFPAHANGDGGFPKIPRPHLKGLLFFKRFFYFIHEAFFLFSAFWLFCLFTGSSQCAA